MSLTTSEMTPADIRACTCGNDNGGGWGADGGAWWIIILFLFVFCGWGGNGWGGNGGGTATQASLTRGDLCMDMNFNDLQNGVRNINDAVNTGFANLNSTICHQQYDTAMLVNGVNNNINGVTAAVNGGFSALNSTICQQQYDTAQQLNAMNMANMQNANAANVVALQNQNALQTQLAQCCCENREGQAQINYNMATQACDTRQTINSGVRDIIDNQNCNARAILDKLTQQEIAAKDAQITAQTQKIFGLELAASQAAQNNYLINTLRPTAVPAYPASSPCGLGNWSPAVLANGYQFNNGCGCNCNCA